MKSERTVGLICLILGAIFLCFATVSYVYFEVHDSWLGLSWVEYPLRGYTMVFLVPAIVLLVIGIVLLYEMSIAERHTMQGP